MFTSSSQFVALVLVLTSPIPTTAQEPRKDQYGDPLPPGAIARIGTVRLRSGSDIDRVALSPDAKLLVTTTEYRPLEVWDGRTGQLLRRWQLAFVLFSEGPQSDGKLFQITDTRDIFGFAFRARQRWQHEPGEDCDDRDDNEQFDKGESTSNFIL